MTLTYLEECRYKQPHSSCAVAQLAGWWRICHSHWRQQYSHRSEVVERSRQKTRYAWCNIGQQINFIRFVRIGLSRIFNIIKRLYLFTSESPVSNNISLTSSIAEASPQICHSSTHMSRLIQWLNNYKNSSGFKSEIIMQLLRHTEKARTVLAQAHPRTLSQITWFELISSIKPTSSVR
jgi:hypothetical protein